MQETVRDLDRLIDLVELQNRTADTHPVMKRLPILALEKSKRELGLNRFTISRLTVIRKLRISSFFGEEMWFHIECCTSTISSHSCLAAPQSSGSLWLNKALIACASEPGSSESGIRRTSLPGHTY